MNALENFELALVAQLHERSQWLLGQRGDASPASKVSVALVLYRSEWRTNLSR